MLLHTVKAFASGKTKPTSRLVNQTSKIAIPRPVFIPIAIAIIWLGFGIRLHNLGGDSLWLDEQLTVQTARMGFPEVLTGARDHPPVVYLLTSLALKEFGETEFTARLVSLLASTLAIPLIMLFGSVLRRPRVGLWAALFLACSPLHLKYAQESRHYALLMTVSLVTYILLYRALSRPKAKYWIGFAVFSALNLYIHYGAFVVLGCQIVLTGLWLIWHLYKHNYKLIWYPLLAAFLTFLLYLPWLPNFLTSLNYNVGASTVSDTGSIAPISQWIREAFNSFGMYDYPLPYGMLALVLLGLFFLVLQRDVLTIGLLVCGMVLPLIFIQVGYVARAAYARYIIYILPLYLFSAAITPATLFADLNLRFGRKLVLPLAIITAFLFIALAWSPIRNEYAHIQDDWRSVVQYLDQNASDGDIVAAFSMKFANGFNTVGSSLPYYLRKQSTNTYTLLHGNKLRHKSLADLQDSTGKIWIVLYDYQFNREAFDEVGFSPKRFQTDLYVMPNPDDRGTTLDQMISIYEKLVPLAAKPSPSCFLEKDLALLYAQSGDFTTAEHRLSRALADCPDYLKGSNVGYDLQSDVPKVVFEGAVSSYLKKNKANDARRVAGILYQLDPHNEVALDALTVFDLLEVFEDGQAQLDDGGSLEPIRVKEFLMPQTGDSGNSLLLHPPGSVSFPITLLEKPVVFTSRIAMDPQSWDWGGDGSTFIVTAATQDGEIIELFKRHISNDPEDRRWHEIEFSLAQFAGQAITLTLKTDPGPAGDFSGDWAGWESPRLMQISP